MTKAEIVANISEKSGIEKADVLRVVEDFMVEVKDSLNQGNNVYLRGLRKAHKIHHKNMGKQDSQCFGMLFVPFEYFKKPKI